VHLSGDDVAADAEEDGAVSPLIVSLCASRLFHQLSATSFQVFRSAVSQLLVPASSGWQSELLVFHITVCKCSHDQSRSFFYTDMIYSLRSQQQFFFNMFF